MRGKYSVGLLCRYLECSRSGYYDWISLGRPAHKSFDASLASLISQIHMQYPFYGIVQIRIQLKRNYNVITSNKTVYRYMRILGIRSIIRIKRKYGPVKEHFTPNLIKRDFKASRPNQKWSIDITYLNSKDGIEYLCAIKDMFDKTIVSHSISNKNDNSLVLEAVKEALQQVPVDKRPGLILHSDQGSQFLSHDYDKLLKDAGVQKSLSFKGACVDNSPIESFFSCLKTEWLKFKRGRTKLITRQLVSSYMDFYHNRRFQKGLNEMTPAEYRRHHYCFI